MSWSRSSSVERRFTKVVFALRSVPGSRPSVWARAWFWAAIAPAVAFALPTRAARSPRRSATVDTRLDASTTKLVNVRWSERTSLIRALVEESAGLKNFAASLACGPLPA